MGLFSRKKPKIKVETKKKDSFSGWLKCTSCAELIHEQEVSDCLNCCPKCHFHYRLPARQRIEQLTDPKTFKEMFSHIRSTDPLGFVDSAPYPERLAKAEETTKNSEAIVTGICRIDNQPTALAVFDFGFMGGSMGSVVGERLTSLIEYATEKQLPVIIVSTSGGARMQESTLALMQMAKTSAALAKLHEARLPFISILTNPTSGGVTASFASLGDLIIAEPEALICFTGPRVIEQTIKHKLPEGAQRSEFLLKHGMIDCIVPRRELKQKLSTYLHYVTGNERAATTRHPLKIKQKKKLWLKSPPAKNPTLNYLTMPPLKRQEQTSALT